MTGEEIRAAIERLEALVRDNAPTVYDVAEVFACVNGYGLRNMLIDLLKQADPDTHVELPKDADGEYIHVGDELISKHSKKKFVVTRLKYSMKHTWMIGGADKDDLSEYGLYAPRETRHYHPTVEDVLREFVNRVMSYNEDEDDGDAMISDCAAKLRELMS